MSPDRADRDVASTARPGPAGEGGPPALVGRAREQARLGQLLDETRDGHGSAWLLSGPAGVGKTVLLDWVRAHAAGMRVLDHVCFETDSQHAFCAVRELVEALEPTISGLVPEQARALASVLGRGPSPTFDAPGLGAALVAALSAAAEREPCVVIVDDAHWVDPSSETTLSFVASRLDDEPVLLLFAAREPEHLFGGRVRSIDVPGLSPLDAVELLGPRVETAVAEQLARATQGNALAMLEIVQQLTEDERRGAVPLPSTLPLGDVVLRGFVRRTEDLGDAERRVLLVASADAALTVRQLQEATTALGFPPSAVTDVLNRGLLVVDERGHVRMNHPLVQRAVYEDAEETDRRAAHRALASIFTEADLDRRAWHLARGVDGIDENAAGALDAAAHMAASRGDPLAAAEAFSRAAEVSTGEARTRRLVAAGTAFATGGATNRALDALDAALAATDDPLVRADIRLERARPIMVLAGPAALERELLDLAASIEPIDRGRAAFVTAVAALPAFVTGEVGHALERSERALAMSPNRRSAAASLAEVVVQIARALAGEGRDAASALVEHAATLSRAPIGPAMIGYVDLLANALLWVDEFSAGSRLASAMVDSARAQSAVAMVAYALTVRADLYARTGHWQAALADATEAGELAGDERAAVVYSLLARARVEAATGDIEDARRHCDAAFRHAHDLGAASMTFVARAILGFVELSAGNVRRAVEPLEAAREFANRQGIRQLTVVPWAPDLVEAYIRCGDTDAAGAVVDELDRQGVAEQGASACAQLWRCRGLVAPDDYDDWFSRALAAHDGLPTPFDRARTELCFGERLRRDRRMREARLHLEAAATAFERIGAVPWFGRATSELATRRATSAPTPPRQLTPQQYRVALAVGRGATTREAAAALFLSPRTVEQHLLHVYRVLNIRSRAELARLVATDPEFSIEPED